MNQRRTVKEMERLLKESNKRAEELEPNPPPPDHERCVAQVVKYLWFGYVVQRCRRRGTRKRYGQLWCWQHAKKARKPTRYMVK